MRTLKVQHETLPHVGDRFEFSTGAGLTVTVVAQQSGQRELAVSQPNDDQPLVTLSLSRTEATALAALLTGVHVELTQTPRA